MQQRKKQQVHSKGIEALCFEFVVEEDESFSLINYSPTFLNQLGLSTSAEFWGILEADTLGEIKSLLPEHSAFQLKGKIDTLHSAFDFTFIPIASNQWHCTLVKQEDKSSIQFPILKEKGETFEKLFNATNTIMCIADKEGRFLQVNEVASYLLGYSFEELTAKPFFNFIHEDDRKKTKKYLKKDEKGINTEDFENRYIHKDGSIVWLRWSHYLDPETNLYFAIAHNITETKKLRLMLHDASEVSKTGAWSYSIPDETVEWSTMTKKIFEVDALHNRELSTALKYFKEGDSRLHAEAVIENARLNGEGWDIELQIVTKKKKEKWVRWIGKPEFYNQKINRLYGSFQDISSRKHNEQLLVETLAEKRIILDSISDAFYTINRQWEISYWNKAAQHFSGLSEEKVLGKSIWSLYPNSDWQKKYEKAIAENQKIQFESYSKQWKIHSEVTLYPSLKGLTVIIKDISERKAAEREIELMNERFQLAAEASNDAIWDWDIDKQTIYWNQSFYEYTGYDKTKVPHHDFKWWVNLLKEEHRKKLYASFINTIKDPDKEVWHQEYSIKKADGSYGNILAKGKFVRNKAGKVIRMVGAFSDITAQKKYEESLKQLNHQLLASNQELEQFAYVISHDLQEPLRMITSFLERLEEKYSNQLDEKGKKYIDFAVDGGKRMRRMVLDLLDYSRVGRKKGSIEAINLNEIIDEVKTLNKHAIELSSAKITYPELPTIVAYRSPIIQLFQNLISNAIKYQRTNVSPQIDIQFTSKQKMLEFRVMDNGIGIHPDFHDKVFTVFQRLHAREEYSGTGIGLAIVKKVVTQLGGKVWIKSSPGEGSTFYFTLPKKIDE